MSFITDESTHHNLLVDSPFSSFELFVTNHFSSDDESSDDDILEEKDEDSDADLGPEFEAPPSPTNPLIVELEDGVSRKERRAQVIEITNN